MNERKAIDEKTANILRALGFKPGQTFKMSTLQDRAWDLFNCLSPEERRNLVGSYEGQNDFCVGIMDGVLLSGSDVVEQYVRFAPIKS
jgi:hypothetical protein